MVAFFVFFFFKQKTAYEMRISDWSSDVCSSDLQYAVALLGHAPVPGAQAGLHVEDLDAAVSGRQDGEAAIGVAQHEKSIRLDLLQKLVRLADDIRNFLAVARGVDVQLIVRLA